MVICLRHVPTSGNKHAFVCALYPELMRLLIVLARNHGVMIHIKTVRGKKWRKMRIGNTEQT